MWQFVYLLCSLNQNPFTSAFPQNSRPLLINLWHRWRWGNLKSYFSFSSVQPVGTSTKKERKAGWGGGQDTDKWQLSMIAVIKINKWKKNYWTCCCTVFTILVCILQLFKIWYWPFFHCLDEGNTEGRGSYPSLSDPESLCIWQSHPAELAPSQTSPSYQTQFQVRESAPDKEE